MLRNCGLSLSVEKYQKPDTDQERKTGQKKGNTNIAFKIQVSKETVLLCNN